MNLPLKRNVKGLISPIILLIAAAFVLLSFRSAEEYDVGALTTGGLLVVLILVHYMLCTKLFKTIDKHILVIVYALVAIGMIMQYRINLDIAFKQLINIAIGMGAMLLALILLGNLSFWKKPVVLLMIGSTGLLALTLVLGKSAGGAKNWINIAGFTFQPSEFVKIALIFIVATYLSERQRLSQLWPMLLFIVCAAGLLVLARDLGAAVLFAGTTLIMYFVATGNYLVTGAGVGAGAVGLYASYKLFDHVKIRVAAWRNPWASYDTSGYQIAQGLMAIASGGLSGLGLTCGTPKIIPAYHTDYIFAVICEEMGIIVGLCVIALFIILILRAIAAAASCQSAFTALIAAGVCCFFALQTFLILGGVIKMIPLTGVTLPFVSYGGSSMIASFIMIGVLQSVVIDNGKRQSGGSV